VARQYTLISSDSHLEIKPERWVHRVAEEHRERAPRTVHMSDGGEAFLIEGRPLQPVNLADNRSGRADWRPIGMKVDDAAGAGGPDQRVQEMDVDGLDAEILFPANQRGYIMWRGIADDDAYRAIVRGYNDWLALDYCAYAPERLIGIGVIPSTNLDDALAELEHCAQLGLRAVLLGAFPSSKSYPSPEDDRFWVRAQELTLAVTVHVRFHFPTTEGPSFIYPKGTPDLMRKVGRGLVEHLAQHGQPPAKGMTQLVLSGLFDRLPNLRVFFAETRVGWLPFFLESLDLWYERNLGWAEDLLGFRPLKRKPSAYIRENIYLSIQYERFAVPNRYYIGVDHMMFASDFPHIECEWPNTRPILDEIYADVPEQERHKIWAGNAASFFKLA
jgi:uncharacterized protein